MKSNKFNIRVLLHVFFIALTSGLFFWAINQENKTVTAISLLILWIVQIGLLIRYVNITNNHLLLFLQSFQFDDSSIIFNKQKKLPFREIYQEFNKIIDRFRDLRIQKEVEHQYFENVVKHVETGLIAWDKNEKIHLLNQAAKKILQIPFVVYLKGFKSVQEDLPNRLRKINPGYQEILKIVKGSDPKSIYIRASEFYIQDEKIKLVSLQNIRPELEEKESEAWQRLIKVLTHEIINSIGPIKLVSSSLLKTLNTKDTVRRTGKLSQEEIDNIAAGLKAINNRSQGLTRFVEDYKTITDIPKPDITVTNITALIQDVISLLEESQLVENIEISINVKPKDLQFQLDKKMVEQILLNIIKNALHALDNHTSPRLLIHAYEDDGNKIIQVEDNGTGIPFNMMDYIFMPFFTTKREGSGIGLTLSRQLMKAMEGQIKINSKDGEGTLVTLTF